MQNVLTITCRYQRKMFIRKRNASYFHNIILCQQLRYNLYFYLSVWISFATHSIFIELKDVNASNRLIHSYNCSCIFLPSGSSTILLRYTHLLTKVSIQQYRFIVNSRYALLNIFMISSHKSKFIIENLDEIL